MKKGKALDIHKVVQIHMVTDHRGWVHTHGMHGLGLPELEVLGCPLFLMNEAGHLLNHLAQYIYDGEHRLNGARPVRLGQVIQLNQRCVVRLGAAEPLAGEEAHYRVKVWRLDDAPMRGACEAELHEKPRGPVQ